MNRGLHLAIRAVYLHVTPSTRKARAMARYKLSEYIESKRSGRQTHIELSDGTILKVDPLELWSDAVLENAQKDQVAAAKALLGPQDYEKFKADGGSAALLLTLVQENQGVSEGESEPSAS